MQIAVFKLFREYAVSTPKGSSSQLNRLIVKILKSKVILLGVIPNKFYCFLRKNTKKLYPVLDSISLFALSHANTLYLRFHGLN